MKLSTEQLARMSRLLNEVIDADAAAREQWLHALPAEHRTSSPRCGARCCRRRRRGVRRLAGQAAESPMLGRQRPARRRSVGPYRLMRLLGAGGMAEVWLAQRADGAFKREVALKTPARLEWRDGPGRTLRGRARHPGRARASAHRAFLRRRGQRRRPAVPRARVRARAEPAAVGRPAPAPHSWAHRAVPAGAGSGAVRA